MFLADQGKPLALIIHGPDIIFPAARLATLLPYRSTGTSSSAMSQDMRGDLAITSAPSPVTRSPGHFIERIRFRAWVGGGHRFGDDDSIGLERASTASLYVDTISDTTLLLLALSNIFSRRF